MLMELFTGLTRMLYAEPHVALSAALLWGVAGIVLSPCHLASIPLVVGFIDRQGVMTTRRAALLSTLFSAGILVTIALIGLVTALIGRLMGDVGRYGNIAVAVILVMIGLYLLGLIPLPFLDAGAGQPGFKKRGAFAAFLLGLIFGVALGPCTFAYMAPMLGIVFGVAAKEPVFAVGLILAYAVGHCGVIVLAGTFTETVQHVLNWNERSRGAVLLKKACGVLVVITGLYMLFSAWQSYEI